MHLGWVLLSWVGWTLQSVEVTKDFGAWGGMELMIVWALQDLALESQVLWEEVALVWLKPTLCGQVLEMELAGEVSPACKALMSMSRMTIS